MAGARAIGLQTILVLSGFTRQEDLATSALEPDLVCQDIAELASLVEAAQGQDVPGVNVEEVAGSRFNDV
jgi:ribonucleotide monophosphatase NagD (HAD superfamily)